MMRSTIGGLFVYKIDLVLQFANQRIWIPVTNSAPEMFAHVINILSMHKHLLLLLYIVKQTFSKVLFIY